MEPENEPLEEEIPMKKPSFLGSMLVFGGVFMPYFLREGGIGDGRKTGILRATKKTDASSF